jgi:hypothetical protein
LIENVAACTALGAQSAAARSAAQLIRLFTQHPV